MRPLINYIFTAFFCGTCAEIKSIKFKCKKSDLMCQNIYLKTRGCHLLIKLNALLKTLRHHHTHEREIDDDLEG